jgi:mRNA-degrading endonuclease RelE of RelBE toxin-antitoxin system
MIWQVMQTRRFARQYKKLHKNTIADIDSAIEGLSQAPETGVRKKGDLSALYVHKFISYGQEYLLGYTLDKEVRLIYLEAIGSHQNFYRDLKNQ